MSSDNLYRVAIHESYAINDTPLSDEKSFLEDDVQKAFAKPSDYQDFDTIGIILEIFMGDK